jgi:hypothetical protein
VPYSRIRRQNNNLYYVYCNYAIKSYFCCHWRNIMSNCATGSSNVTKILRLVRTRTIAPLGGGEETTTQVQTTRPLQMSAMARSTLRTTFSFRVVLFT